MISTDRRHGDLIEKALGVVLWPDAVCIAAIGADGIRGVISFDKITTTDAEMQAVGATGFMSRRLLQYAGDLMFGVYGLKRITAYMRPANTYLHAVAKRAGFVEEGRIRKFYPDGVDAVIFGLLKEDYPYHGRFQQTSEDSGPTAANSVAGAL